MNKKKLIIFISIIAAFVSSCIIAYAAFIFQKNIDGDAEVGEIVVSEKSFLVYDNEFVSAADTSYVPGKAYYSNIAGIYTYNTSVTADNFNALKSDLYTYNVLSEEEPATITDSSIVCYATRKGGYSEETDNPYLNQLSFQFSFETDMAVYLRIHIEDSWLSTKIYNNGTTITNFVKKDYIGNSSPFTPEDTKNWIYDSKTNCVYYKNMIDPKSDEYQNLLTAGVVSFKFDVDNEYFYTILGATHNYREAIQVEVSFFIDIVQANRAEQKWDVDFDTLGII